jgi:lauroyl/myristoyl acyltransferase
MFIGLPSTPGSTSSGLATLCLNPDMTIANPKPDHFCRPQTQEMYEQYQQKMRSQKYFGLQPSRREAIPRMKESLRSLGGWLGGDSTTPPEVSQRCQ